MINASEIVVTGHKPLASGVMMALGDFRFSIATAAFDELERSNEWRWPSLERIGVKPAVQFTGPGEEKIDLKGSIYPHFIAQSQGLDQLPQMRALADLGLPQMLVDGSGRVWGEYVIESIRETRKVLFSNGLPRCIEFSMALKAYGG